MKLDISSIQEEDLYDKLSHIYNTEPDSAFSRCIHTVNEAFLLGMYFKRWDSDIYLPMRVRQTVRHITKLVEPHQHQIDYWSKKYIKDGNDMNNYLAFSEYLLSYFVHDDSYVMKLLALHLGIKYGQKHGLWWELSFVNHVVLARTSGDHIFLGVCRQWEDGELILSQAHELVHRCESTIDGMLEKGEAYEVIDTTLITDAVEIRDCSIDQLKVFCNRLDLHTYDEPLSKVEQLKD